MNGKLIARGFQRDQNYQISPYISKVIAPASQRPNSDCVVFSWVKSHGRLFTFWGLYKAPIVTQEDTIWSYPLLRALLSFLVFSLLVDSSTPPLWIQGLKRLVLWIQILTLLEDQGLWIQVFVLLCSCDKAASSGIRARFIVQFQFQVFKNVWMQVSLCSSFYFWDRLWCGPRTSIAQLWLMKPSMSHGPLMGPN